MMKKLNVFINVMLLFMVISGSVNCQSIRLFAGGNAEAGEKGFFLFDLNRDEGTFKVISQSDAGPNPSYFCISKNNSMIYAANEVMKLNGKKGGGVTALRYNTKSDAIEKVKELVVPKGGPCYISLSPDEGFLFMANYSSGSIAVVKLDNKGIPERVTDSISFSGAEGKASHPHMILSDPSGKRVYLTDLGLDQVVIYNFDKSSGHLQQADKGIVKLPAGTGPRHFVFNSTGSKLYVIGELNSTVTVFNVSATNDNLTPVQTISTLKEGFKGQNACADIHIGKSGDYLYGSNRGENSIVTYKIGPDGLLTFAGNTSCGGIWPRNFVIDPSGNNLLVANQRSENISLFRIDKKTGIPVATGKESKVKAPMCLKFLN